MSDWVPPVALVGPAEETQALSPALEEAGYRPVCYASPETFLNEALREPPAALVLWAAAAESALDDLYQVLHHHLWGQRCPVVLVGKTAQDSSAFGTRGACFVSRPAEPAQVLRALRECGPAPGDAAGHIPRVLVVDDDQGIVLLGSHIVSGMGMIPLVAFDGPEAIEKVRSQTPDLILLDINMPGMDGFQVIDALKADPVACLTPIIVFSARRSEDDKVRALKAGADDYVTKPFSLPELAARMERLLKRTRADVSASSTTGLPGSVSVEQVLGERIRKRLPLGVLYLDVDNFKVFNDCYGFSRGDSVIRQTADLALEAVRELGNPDDFVGHIGGDDFVVVSTPERAVPIAERVIQNFDRIVPLYYDRGDRERGYLETEDRKGRMVRFPLMSLSIAVVTNEGRAFHHVAQVADLAAQLKKYAKTRPGSLWVKDLRGNGGADD